MLPFAGKGACSLSAADSGWELYTVHLAWQNPPSGLKSVVSQDSRLLEVLLWGLQRVVELCTQPSEVQLCLQ